MMSRALWVGLWALCATAMGVADENRLPFLADISLFRVTGDVGPLLTSILPPEQRSVVDAISSKADSEDPNLNFCGTMRDADALRAGLVAATSDASGQVVDIQHGARLTVPLGVGRDAVAPVEIRDDQPIYYFTPAGETANSADSGTLFELRKWEPSPGMKLTLQVGRLDMQNPQNPVAGVRTWILPAVVVARNCIEDTSLKAGEPVMGTTFHNVMLQATLGKWTAIVLHEPSSQGSPRKTLFLLVKLSAASPDLDLLKVADSPSVEEPQYSAEFKILHVKHDFGEKALSGLPALSKATRISGDAAAFSFPYDVERLEDLLLLPDGTVRPILAGEEAPQNARHLSAQLLSAPRVAVSTPQNQVRCKVILRNNGIVDTEGTSGTTGGQGNGTSQPGSVFSDPVRSRQFLYRDLDSFLTRSAGPAEKNRKPLVPAVISDAKEETFPYLRQERGSIYRLHNDVRDSFGFACGIALTELDDGAEIEANVLFRHNDMVELALIEGTNLPAGPPVIDQAEFRYVVRVKPNEWIGFAYPRKDGHMIVLMRVQKNANPGSVAVH